MNKNNLYEASISWGKFNKPFNEPLEDTINSILDWRLTLQEQKQHDLPADKIIYIDYEIEATDKLLDIITK